MPIRPRVAFRSVALSLATLTATPLFAQSTTYTLLGDIGRVQRTANGVLLRAQHGTMLVEAVSGVGMRVRVRFGEAPVQFPTPHSLATGDTPPSLATYTLREAGDTVIMTSQGIEARATKHPLRLTMRDAAGHDLLDDSFGAATYNGRLVHYVRDVPGTRYYALGEQPVGMLRNRGVFPFWNTDHFAYGIGGTPIYSTMPFYIGVTSGIAHGVLYDNPFKGEMDFANRLPGSIGYEATGGPDGGELRYYVMAGPGLDTVLARLTRLTGRMPLPPRWSVGYQQSRYSYAPDSMVMNVATEFRRRDIPLDALYLDIHYMNGYRVFTWSPSGFPHPKQLLDSLGRMGVKVIPIVDPGVKKDSGYFMYQQGLARHAFVTLPGGSIAYGRVWPDTAAYPDFSRPAVRAWWGDSQRALLDVGVRGIWNDMNEPSSFLGGTLSELAQFDGGGRPGTHLEYHNQYGMLMARASYEGQRHLRPNARPFTVTRAGYLGVQRYSSMWTGDNQSTWDHLKVSIPMVLSLGLTGEPFAGSDIGGFAGSPSAELYARWLQSAALLPFFRTHSSVDVPRREPWVYGPEYERANRATIRLRYRLLPVVYTAFRQHATTGVPVVRPVFWSQLADTTALTVNDEYFLGDHVLAAPVVDSAANERAVYLPAGHWFRLGDDSSYAGARRVRVAAPEAVHDGGDTTGLRGLPIFVRAGAVIPMQAVLPYSDARRLDTLELHVWPGATTTPVTSELYEDAGDGYAYEHGDYRLTTFTTSLNGASGGFDVALTRAGTFTGARTFAVTLHATERPRSVTVDGRTVTTTYDGARRTVSFVVPGGISRIVVVP